MKFDEYSVVPLEYGRAQIMFTEPLDTDWEISLFMQFFEKHKKKIAVTYKIKPKVKIEGLICQQKTWASFLKFIQRETAAIDFEKEMKELSYDEMVSCLEDLKQAEIKEHDKQMAKLKEIKKRRKKK